VSIVENIPDARVRAAPSRRRLTTTFRPLERFSLLVDGSSTATSVGGTRLRRVLALFFGGYALVLATHAVARREPPSAAIVLILVLAAALFVNRGGRFIRDWIPVLLLFEGYFLAGRFAEQLTLPVHYLPQISLDRAIGLGTTPTEWLQSHLYHGKIGWLELASLGFYLSHYFTPVLLGGYLWWFHERSVFRTFMYSLIAASALAEFTFVLAPTAPPWLAAQHGDLPHVHHIMKVALASIGQSGAAAHLGSAGSYNIVAALPSLHAAWPFVGLIVCRSFRLPRLLLALLTFECLGVLFAIVYTGEHYVVDAVAGWGYALAGYVLVTRILRSELTETVVPGRV
jgi:hypothetical protein